jgi:hypothetical protein
MFVDGALSAVEHRGLRCQLIKASECTRHAAHTPGGQDWPGKRLSTQLYCAQLPPFPPHWSHRLRVPLEFELGQPLEPGRHWKYCELAWTGTQCQLCQAPVEEGGGGAGGAQCGSDMLSRPHVLGELTLLGNMQLLYSLVV